MNKLEDRWKNNGTWEKLSKLKEIFMEPKGTTHLPQIMQTYRSVIEQPSSESSGAILFAVFRGKIAEGIDFSNNEARCVLAVNNTILIALIIYYICMYVY